MTKFLSEEWVNAFQEYGSGLPAMNFSIICQYEISGAPQGKVRYFVIFKDGKTTKAELGKSESPDCLVSTTHDEAISILHQRSTVAGSFMKGTLKIEGEYEKYLLGMNKVRSTNEWANMLLALREDLET
jgi:putative sterol carrier protein